MYANVNVNGDILKVSVGTGQQTFKWLAQVVQGRVSEAKSLRSSFGPDAVVVVGIKNFADQLINPMDRLFEHKTHQSDERDDLHCELEFIAEVLPQFESDKWGNPVYNDWMHAAYMVSESALKWSADMQHWRENEIEKLKKKKEAMDDDDQDYDDNDSSLIGDGSEWNSDLNAGSSLIQIGEDQFSSNDVRNYFTMDWGNIKFLWANNFPISAKIAVHDLLKTHYGVICHLFLHYCGVGKVGQRFGMTLREFNHLLTFATKEHKNDITIMAESIYYRVTGIVAERRASTAGKTLKSRNRRRGEKGDKNDRFDRSDSLSNSTSTDSIPGQGLGPSSSTGSIYSPPGSASGRNGLSNSSSNHAISEEISEWPLLSRAALTECLMCYAVDAELGSTIPEAIENFILGPLTSLLTLFREKFLKYTEYESTTVKESYYLLRQTFLQKACIHPVYGPAVTLDHFQKIATSASLLTEADGLIEKEKLLCETAFASALLTSRTIAKEIPIIIKKSSRLRPTSEEKEESKGDEFIPTPPPEDALLSFSDELVFSEFVEALARLALMTMQTARDLSNARKIRLCYSFIVEQDQESTEEYGPGSFSEGKE